MATAAKTFIRKSYRRDRDGAIFLLDIGKRSLRPANAIFRGRTEFLCHNAQQMDSDL